MLQDLLMPVFSMLLAEALVAILCFCSSRKGDWAKNATSQIFTLMTGLLIKTIKDCD